MATNNSIQLSEQIAETLMNEIRNGRFRNASILPPEIELAAFFNISRTTIRDVLAILEREGYISRRRKIGTIINRYVFEVKTRIDLEREFLDIVRGAGYQVSSETLKVWFGEADEEEAKRLNLLAGDPVLHCTKVIYADDEPVIYCIDTIAKSLIRRDGYTDKTFDSPIFDFMKEYCDAESQMALSDVHAENADKEVAGYLQIPEGEAVLHLQETEYDFLGTPIMYSSEYYREGKITHTILRKKIK